MLKTVHNQIVGTIALYLLISYLVKRLCRILVLGAAIGFIAWMACSTHKANEGTKTSIINGEVIK